MEAGNVLKGIPFVQFVFNIDAVFAMIAWLYNQLGVYGLDFAQQISQKMLLTFIVVAIIAPIAFLALSVEMFLIGKEGVWKQKRWILVNPLTGMLILTILGAILPKIALVNGIFKCGQQSISLFIVFLLFIKKEREKL